MDAKEHNKKERSMKIPMIRKDFKITQSLSKLDITTMIAIVAMLITLVAGKKF